jgi:hypothetical protein
MIQRLLKAKAMLELKGQGLNDIEIMRRYLLAMDVDDIEKLFPDENAKDPVEELTLQKVQTELAELDAKIEKLRSETALNYAKIGSEYHLQGKTTAGIINDDRKLDIDEMKVMQQIKLGRSQQSLGKAPNGLKESTMKREYGLKTNNKE